MEVKTNSIPKVSYIPNMFLQCQLFGITANGKRENHEDKKISFLNGMEVFYSGESLRQQDLDVYLSLISKFNKISFDEDSEINEKTLMIVESSVRDILDSMQWTRQTKNRNTLIESLERLNKGYIKCKIENNYFKHTVSTNLISRLETYDDKIKMTSKIIVAFDPKLMKLLNYSKTRIDISCRSRLKPTEKWLYGFYSTHSVPFKYSLKKLHSLSGSNSDLRIFKSNIIKASETLIKAGFFEYFSIDNENNVHCSRVKKDTKNQSIEDDPVSLYIDAVVYHQKDHRISLDEFKSMDLMNEGVNITYVEFKGRSERHLTLLKKIGRIEHYVPFPKEETIQIVGGGDNA
jgi:hypothetical protein